MQGAAICPKGCDWLDGGGENLMLLGWIMLIVSPNVLSHGHVIEIQLVHIQTHQDIQSTADATETLYSPNHNLMRTVGFIAIMAAVTGWHCRLFLAQSSVFPAPKYCQMSFGLVADMILYMSIYAVQHS